MSSTPVRPWVALCSMVLGMTLLMSGATADAQEAPAPGGVDVQNFRAAGGPGGLLVVEGADTADHLQPYGSLFIDHFSNPLVLSHGDGERQPIVDQRTNAQLFVGVGVWDRFQFELGMPVMLLNRGEYLGQSIDGAGPGDLESRAKATILSSHDDVVGLGASLDLTLPTGHSDRYAGSTTATATPQLIADSRFETPAGNLLVAANVGTRLRATETVHNREIGPEMTYGVGGELEVLPGQLSVGADLFGGLGLGEFGRESNPLELLLSTRLEVMDGLSVTAGGGGGLVGGVGSPAWRGLLGVTYSPTGRIGGERADETAVSDDIGQVRAQECPPEPAGFEGPYDDEGCAITPDNFDGCEGLDDDWEGAVDEWGCPMLDSDGDGFLVWDDECPLEPIEFIGVDNDDGCPNYDISGDGIPNVDDHCPYQDGLERYDGCPPPEEEEQVERRGDEIEIDERLHFETDKAIILPASYDLLEEVALVMREHSDILVVEIAGHTDQRGDADYNRMLSEERAKAVREFLIERGNIHPARLNAEGYGSDEPVIEDDSDEAHAENRRVEFRILETGEEGEAQ